MRHNTRGSGDRIKGSPRSNERNEDSKGQSSLLCLQLRALAVQGARADKAEGQTEGCRAWSFRLLLQDSVCDTPSDTKLGAKEQRLLWTNCAAALNPHWVGHKPEITSLFPKAWERFGQILRAQRLTVYLAAKKRKNRLCLGKHFPIKWECSWVSCSLEVPWTSKCYSLCGEIWKSSKAVIAKNIPGNVWKLCKTPTVIRDVTNPAVRPYAKLHSDYV